MGIALVTKRITIYSQDYTVDIIAKGWACQMGGETNLADSVALLLVAKATLYLC